MATQLVNHPINAEIRGMRIQVMDMRNQIKKTYKYCL
jgi:hypothetical protein